MGEKQTALGERTKIELEVQQNSTGGQENTRPWYESE